MSNGKQWRPRMPADVEREWAVAIYLSGLGGLALSLLIAAVDFLLRRGP